MAAQYFEKILLDLKNKTTTKKSLKSLIAECCDVVVQREWLAGVSVNVCGAAEAPEEQTGK